MILCTRFDLATEASNESRQPSHPCLPEVNLQKSENARLQQQVTTLKGEKTSIHQQIIALQRRIEEIEEEIGNE